MDEYIEQEFLSDEEVTEMLDSIVLAIGEIAEEEDAKTAVLSEIKLQQIRFTYSVLRYLTKDKAVKLTYKLHEPFKSMGSVSVEGEDLSFTNAEWFARAAEFASNVDIYPLVNGKVRITFTFHGLTTPIE